MLNYSKFQNTKCSDYKKQFYCGEIELILATFVAYIASQQSSGNKLHNYERLKILFHIVGVH